MHLIDIENLTGGGSPTAPQVQRTMAAYGRLVPIGRLDQFIVAANPGAIVAVGLALGGVQLLARAGRDGADHALTEAAVTGRVDLRFERVVIGSGDGYFADLARWLVAAGLHVSVVSRPRSLHHLLRAAATEVIALDPDEAEAA